MNAEVIFVIGANPTVNHPVAATWMKNAAKTGAKLIVADPRRSELARHATYNLQFKADTDVALLNAMLHVIVEEGLVDEAFVRDRTSGYEALAENVKKFSPEEMAPICGIHAQTIREVARLYATSKGSMILWGMGISQHVHGTDNARCLIALALSTGQIGRPGTGLHPLRGQNNVQGASDSGPDPDDVSRLPARRHARSAGSASRSCGAPELDPEARAHRGRDHQRRRRSARSAACTSWARTRRCPIPDVDHAREALATLEHLVVQDIFLTETAYLADVVLPATAWPEKVGTVTNTDRMVQLGRKAIEPPGEAKDDLWIIVELAKRMGLRLELRASARGVQRDAPVHGLDRGHHLGAARARLLGDLSVRERRRSRASRSCSSRISRPPPAAASSCRPT